MAVQSFGDVRVAQITAAAARSSGATHFALRWTFSPTNTFWVPSGEVAAAKILAMDPGADVLDARLVAIPDATEDAGFISGSATIGYGSYTIVDTDDGIDFSLSDALQARFANRQAVRGSVLALMGCDDEGTFDEASRIRTNFGVTYHDTEGSIEVEFEGVHTLLRGSVFAKQTWRIASTVEVGDMFLPIAFPATVDPVAERLPAFEHDDVYSTDPNFTVGYLRTSENEIVSYYGDTFTLLNGQYGIVLHERGLFGSTAVTIPVESNSTFDNLPEVTEAVVFEESTSDVLALLIAGVTTDGRIAPPGWSANLGLQRLDMQAIASALVGNEVDRFRYDDPDEEELKSFLEGKVLKDIPAVLLDNEFGQFVLRKRVIPTLDTITTATFTEEDLDLDHAITVRHAVDKLNNPLIMKRGRNILSKNFEQADIIFADHMLGMYGEGIESKTYEYSGWLSSLGSSSALLSRMLLLREIHQDETVSVTIQALPHMSYVQVGEVVRLKLPPGLVRNASVLGKTKSQPIDDSFLVVAKSSSSESGVQTFALYATLGRAIATSRSRKERNLTLEAYQQLAPYNLKDFVASDMVDGIRVFQPGTYQIPANRYYFIEEKARVPPGCTIEPSGFGYFIGIAHYDDLLVQSDPFLQLRGMSLYPGTDTDNGSPGYIGEGQASGSTLIGRYHRPEDTPKNDSNVWIIGAVSKPPPRKNRRATHSRFPGFALVLDNGQLGNLPRAISGSGGAGGGAVTTRWSAQSLPRTTGGRGGMSAVFIGPRLSASISGVYADVSGEAGETRSAGSLYNVVSGGAEHGSPGICAFIVDGDNPAPLLSDTSVVAINGYNAEPNIPRFARPNVQLYGTTFERIVQSHYPRTPARDRWRAHTAIMFTPAAAELDSRALNAFDGLFEAEIGLDGKSTLYLISDAQPPAFPGNADVNDYAAVESDVTNAQIPVDQVRIYQLFSSGWEIVDFPDVIAEFRIQQYRERGTTVLWVTEGRPAYGEYTVGDSWYDRESRRLYYLGATPEEDVLISEDNFSDYTGLNFLSDPTFADYLAGRDTLAFHRSLDEPLLIEGQTVVVTAPSNQPGTTTDAYLRQKTLPYDYVLSGAAQWAESSDGVTSQAGGGSGDGVVFYDGDQGFLQDTDPRKVWVYAQGSGTLKIQGGGPADNAGDPGLQVSFTISSGSLGWVQGSGLFPSYAAQLQLRTQAAGIEVKRIILIDQNSQSTPLELSGFGGGTDSTATRGEGRPFWPVPNAQDRLRPLPPTPGGSGGPVTVGLYGRDAAPGVKIDYSGSSVLNIMTERFPFKAAAGKSYLLTAIVKNTVTTGFSLPDAMGVSLVLECYDVQRKKILTTYVAGSNSERWMSRNNLDFQQLTHLVDIPDSANTVAWAALKLVVKGNATGNCRIDSWNATEAPYKQKDFILESNTWYDVHNSSTVFFANQTNAILLRRFQLDGKRGMNINIEFVGEARFSTDLYSGSGSRIKHFANFRAQMYYVDADGNGVGTPLPGGGQAAVWGEVLPRPIFVDFIYDGGPGPHTNDLRTEWRTFSYTGSLLAEHDFPHIDLTANIHRFFPHPGIPQYVQGENPVNDFQVRNLKCRLIFGDSFLPGYQN